MVFTYPALVHNDPEGLWLEFPDLPVRILMRWWWAGVLPGWFTRNRCRYSVKTDTCISWTGSRRMTSSWFPVRVCMFPVSWSPLSSWVCCCSWYSFSLLPRSSLNFTASSSCAILEKMSSGCSLILLIFFCLTFFEVNGVIVELIKGRHKFNNFHAVSLKGDMQCNVSGNCVRCAVLISKGIYKAQNSNIWDNCCWKS